MTKKLIFANIAYLLLLFVVFLVDFKIFLILMGIVSVVTIAILFSPKTLEDIIKTLPVFFLNLGTVCIIIFCLCVYAYHYLMNKTIDE